MIRVQNQNQSISLDKHGTQDLLKEFRTIESYQLDGVYQDTFRVRWTLDSKGHLICMLKST